MSRRSRDSSLSSRSYCLGRVKDNPSHLFHRLTSVQLAPAHESALGPSRHFAAKQSFGRYRGIADMVALVAGLTLVANDPKRS
jgi:hypothetical protein